MKNLLLSCSPECFKLIIKLCITHYVNETSQHPQEVWAMMFEENYASLDDLCESLETREDALVCAISLIESLY